MGKRGPKPLPTNLLRLRGNPNLGHTRASEPLLDACCPDPPAWLGDRERELWMWTVENLAPLDIVGRVDREALAAYCCAAVRFRECQEMIQADGVIVDGQPHPAIVPQAKAFEQMRRAGAMFGLSPSDRASLGSIRPQKPATSRVGRLLA